MSEDLRLIIGKNILSLRQESKMTQQTFGLTFNYSDKAVSKWERGEALPDISVLKQIADYFGVSVDYLLTLDHQPKEDRAKRIARTLQKNRFIISLMATGLVWLIVTLAFVILSNTVGAAWAWLAASWGVPVSAIVLLVFNSIWGIRRRNFIIISVLVWAFLICVQLTILVVLDKCIWILYILGIPAQAIILLWSGIKPVVKKFKLPRFHSKSKKTKEEKEDSK